MEKLKGKSKYIFIGIIIILVAIITVLIINKKSDSPNEEITQMLLKKGFEYDNVKEALEGRNQ